MKTEPVVGIQSAVLKWARESIGLRVEDVAHKLKRPPEDILAWEKGDSAPTYVQLENLAYKIFKRPLAVFFLPAPPEEAAPVREFRTLPEADLRTLHVDTYFQIRRAHAYQLTLKELFDGHNPSTQRLWQEVTLSLQQPVAQQAATLRQALGISLEKQIAWKSDDVALKGWREAIEERGIFVFKAPFKQKEISGFCLLDAEFPLVYLNNSTTKTRQVFSLLHELAHLLLSVNGLSKFDQRYVERLPDKEKQIERFCNAIAAEILIPSPDFQVQVKQFPPDIERASEHQFAELAARYGVSREAILRRFLDQGSVTSTFYERKAKAWAAQQKKGKGGDWYASKNAYLSDRFAKEVVSRHYKNQLSVEQAADFLEIKPKNFAGLERRILQGATA